MLCLSCNKEVHPVADLQPGGRILNMCPLCNTPIAPVAQPDAGTPGPTPTHQTTHAPTPRPKAGPVDLIGAAKERLADIDKELERLHGLQRERRKLAAMVAAAEAADDDEPAALAAE